MALKFRVPDNCQHPWQCSGKKTGPHSPEWPTRHALGNLDVRAFMAQYGSIERPRPGVVIARATYKGLTASSTGDDLDSLRFIAENLIDCVSRGVRA